MLGLTSGGIPHFGITAIEFFQHLVSGTTGGHGGSGQVLGNKLGRSIYPAGEGFSGDTERSVVPAGATFVPDPDTLRPLFSAP